MVTKSTRKQKRSRNKPVQALKKKRPVESPAVNFISFVFGLASALVLAALVYKSFFDTSPPEEIVFNEPEIKEQLSAFEEVLASDSPDKMVDYLIKMKAWPRQASLPARFEFQKKRMGVADKALQYELSEDNRAIAVESLIEAASQMYGLDYVTKLGDANVANILEDAIGDYENDSNPVVAAAALQASNKLHFFEFSKSRDPKHLSLARTSLINLLNRFDDERSIEVAGLLVMRLLKEDKESGIELTNELLDLYRGSDRPRIQRMVMDLHDRSILQRNDFESIFNDRRAFGNKGRTQLVNKTIELMDLPETGPIVFDAVHSVARWLEEVSDWDRARLIYVKASDRAKDIPAGTFADQVKTFAENGLKRIEATSQPVEFEDKMIDGRMITSRDLLGKSTVIVFWSSQDDGRSRAMLANLSHELSRNYMSGIPVISVCVDDIPSQKMVDLLRAMNFRQITGTACQIYKTFPVDATPYIALLDHECVFRKIAVRVENLETAIGFLRSERRKNN